MKATWEMSAAAEGRAWANVFLLGSDAKNIVDTLKSMKVDKKDQDTLSLFQSRLERWLATLHAAGESAMK
jgi:hypothetical protein